MLKFKALTQAAAEAYDWDAAALSTLLLMGNQHIPAAIAAGDTVILLTDDEQPVGMVQLAAQPIGEKPRCLVVQQIALLPDHRRRGLGKMLMGIAADTAVGRGIWFLAAKVPEEENVKAFAAAIHLQKTKWFEDFWLLDLSDVDGLRHG